MSDLLLCHCISWALRIGRFCQKCKYTCFSKLCKSCKVYHAACCRRTVYFEVAGMDYSSCRSMDSYSHRIRYRVVDMYELYRHTAKLYALTGLYSIELCLAEKIMLLELASDKSERQRRSENRKVDLSEKIRK